MEECKIDMDNLKLTTVEGVLYDEDDAKDTPWFYGEGDEYSNSNGYDISKMKILLRKKVGTSGMNIVTILRGIQLVSFQIIHRKEQRRYRCRYI